MPAALLILRLVAGTLLLLGTLAQYRCTASIYISRRTYLPAAGL
jgi:hypothetical protein